MARSGGSRGAWWRRLSGESRASMARAVGIAAFLLFVAANTAAMERGVPIAVKAVHVLVVLVVGWIFVRCLRSALAGTASRNLVTTLLIAGVPVLAAVWLHDWTLGCVWAACAFLVLPGRWALTAFAVAVANLVTPCSS